MDQANVGEEVERQANECGTAQGRRSPDVGGRVASTGEAGGDYCDGRREGAASARGWLAGEKGAIGRPKALAANSQG
jgi:hypothetical protein